METKIINEAIKQYKPKNTRKRFLVTEGDLFQLYKEIAQVRNKEQRDLFYADFKKLIAEAQEVVITPKKN